jgi:hypothetical protein
MSEFLFWLSLIGGTYFLLTLFPWLIAPIILISIALFLTGMTS